MYLFVIWDDSPPKRKQNKKPPGRKRRDGGSNKFSKDVFLYKLHLINIFSIITFSSNLSYFLALGKYFCKSQLSNEE